MLKLNYLTENKSLIYNISIALLIILVLSLLIPIMIDVEVVNAFKYLLYIICYLFIPGFAIIGFINKRLKSIVLSRDVVFSITFGLIIEIILFIISSAFLNSFLLLRIYPVLFVILLIFEKTGLFQLKEQILNFNRFSLLQTLIIWFIILLFSWLYIIQYMGKPIMESPIYIDLIWGLGIVKEFINNFPWQNPHYYSGVFKYHYFVFIHNAASITNSTAPADLVYLIMDSIFLISVILFLIYRISDLVLSRWYLSLIPVWFISFLAAFFPITSIGINTYLILSPTYAFSNIFYLTIIYVSMRNTEIKLSHTMVYALLFFAAMGSKGSVAPVMLCAFCVATFFQIIQKENWKAPLIIVCILIFEFVLQYYFQFGNNKRATALLSNPEIDTFLLLKSIGRQLLDVRIVSLIIFGFAFLKLKNARFLIYFSISGLLWIFLLFHYEPPAVWDKFYFYSYAAIPLTILFTYILFEDITIKNTLLRYTRYLFIGIFFILILMSVRNTGYRITQAINPNNASFGWGTNYILTDSEIDLIKFSANNKDKFQYYYLDNSNYNDNPTHQPGVDKKYLDLCYRITAYGEIRRLAPKDLIKHNVDFTDLKKQNKDRSFVIFFSDVNSIFDKKIFNQNLENIYENEDFIVFSQKKI